MQRMLRPSRFVGALLTCCLFLVPYDASACLVCVPYPEQTATDRLLKADTVVLARENPDKPFSYAAVRVLKGALPPAEINLFVDSATRRRLDSNPDQFMVLTFERSASHWGSAGYATTAYRELVENILSRAHRWEGPQGARDRAHFFIPYIGHDDTAIQRLAYLEVGKASYDTIRKADAFLPAEKIQRFLGDPRYLEWRRLYILLLGVNANESEKRMIRSRMHTSAKLDQTLNLSAWATALIEVDGEAAIDWLEDSYLGNPGRDSAAVLEIVKALSVHGARDFPRLRRRIAASYGVLIRTHASLAGWAARDLTAWNDWRYAASFAELRDKQLPLDGETAYAIDYYIGRAGYRP